MGYYKKALSGISYMGMLRVLTRGLAFAKTAVLARVLTPSQFGVYGVGTLALGFLEMLTETGINIFLIQEKNRIDKYINSSWVVSIFRGFIIGFLIFVSTPLIANFFGIYESKNILYLISLVPIIRGFINPACVKYQKSLNFKMQFFYEGGLFFVDALFAIIIGVITKSEHSLIYGMLLAGLLEVFLSFKLFSPKPKFIFEKEKTLKVINRGKWITGAGIFNYLFMHLDDIFVGKMLSPTALGFYQQAYRVSSMPVSEVGEVFNKVTFPIYTTISNDKKRLRKAFLKTLLTIILFAFPIGYLIFKFPFEITRIIYGESWIAIVPILQILAIFGVFKAISNSFFSLFLGINKQEIVTFITMVSTVVLLALIYPFIRIFGVLGAGYATIIASLASLPFAIYFFVKYTK